MIDRRLAQMLKAELALWPGVTFRLEPASKHDKIILTHQGREQFVTCQRTASDGRGLRNTIADLRRTLKRLGAETIRK